MNIPTFIQCPGCGKILNTREQDSNHEIDITSFKDRIDISIVCSISPPAACLSVDIKFDPLSNVSRSGTDPEKETR